MSFLLLTFSLRRPAPTFIVGRGLAPAAERTVDVAGFAVLCVVEGPVQCVPERINPFPTSLLGNREEVGHPFGYPF